MFTLKFKDKKKDRPSDPATESNYADEDDTIKSLAAKLSKYQRKRCRDTIDTETRADFDRNGSLEVIEVEEIGGDAFPFDSSANYTVELIEEGGESNTTGSREDAMFKRGGS